MFYIYCVLKCILFQLKKCFSSEVVNKRVLNGTIQFTMTFYVVAKMKNFFQSCFNKLLAVQNEGNTVALKQLGC